MVLRPVTIRVVGSSRPHLLQAKQTHIHPNHRRPGGPPVPGADPTVEAGAACAEVETELFFSEHAAAIEIAKSICESCPVRTACLDRAQANGEQFGVFGGLTAQERRALRSRSEAA
ncbi:WhiB family transcriptional regulator [Streptomyces albidus (ex Kaewkla and Franco 2022)]|uniref:WhiB family transcriptional regulator n=1 Tax=Streptomyces albidus (ex Kaewkla and Franco 2022) TaxID=722709 RepID=UPI0015EF24EB|nr:WhiB family transcriptional regulator [Streptomyces albidus (ex Kaewkla and Franco 2022)]